MPAFNAMALFCIIIIKYAVEMARSMHTSTWFITDSSAKLGRGQRLRGRQVQVSVAPSLVRYLHSVRDYKDPILLEELDRWTVSAVIAHCVSQPWPELVR
jgi:hypothetical protein